METTGVLQGLGVEAEIDFLGGDGAVADGGAGGDDKVVRDVEGFVRWRVRVAPGELTCMVCGETFPADWSRCPRCTNDEENSGHDKRFRRTPVAPTISYLRSGEYEVV